MRPVPVFAGLFVMCIAASVVSVPAEGRQKGKPKGVQWEFRVVDDANKAIDEGKFVAADNKIFHLSRQVGTYTNVAAGQVKVEITGYPKLNGTLNLRSDGGSPPLWKGELERPDGARYKVSVKFVTLK
jgi:hypothetical protein